MYSGGGRPKVKRPSSYSSTTTDMNGTCSELLIDAVVNLNVTYVIFNGPILSFPTSLLCGRIETFLIRLCLFLHLAVYFYLNSIISLSIFCWLSSFKICDLVCNYDIFLFDHLWLGLFKCKCALFNLS